MTVWPFELDSCSTTTSTVYQASQSGLAKCILPLGCSFVLTCNVFLHGCTSPVIV